jgi:arylsulfatase A-like enzyme
MAWLWIHLIAWVWVYLSAWLFILGSVRHLGDRDSHLPTVHGFDEFLGNLYHLNAEEEPETYYYPKDPAFRKKDGPRGVLHAWSDGKGGQKIEDTGPVREGAA